MFACMQPCGLAGSLDYVGIRSGLAVVFTRIFLLQHYQRCKYAVDVHDIYVTLQVLTQSLFPL